MPGVKGDCQKEPQESTQAWGWVDGGARFLACLAQLSAYTFVSVSHSLSNAH